MLSKLFVLVALTFHFAQCACPIGFDPVGSHGCFKLGMDFLSWADADMACRDKDKGDHLWIIGDKEEFDEVIEYLGNVSSKRQKRSGARPSYWTDAVWKDGVSTWENTKEVVKFEPKMGTNHNVCCSGQGCFHQEESVSGDCLAVGLVSFGALDSGWGFLGCQCRGNSTLIQYICEAKA